MESVTLEQLEKFDEWLTLVEEGIATQSDLEEWLGGQENSKLIPVAYVDVFLGGESD